MTGTIALPSEKELYDDGISNTREYKRNLNKTAPYFAIGHDGARIQDGPLLGYLAGSGERRELPKYPFIDGGKFKQNWGRLITYYIVKKASQGYRERLGQRTEVGLTAKNIFRDFVDLTIEGISQQFDTLFLDTFPKLRAWDGYYNGASKIDTLYTVEFMGYELPIYARDIDDPEPTEDKLKESVNTVATTLKSPLNGPEFRNLFDGNFTYSANKITRNDYSRLIDQNIFQKWFTRDEAWVIQQYGKRVDNDIDKEITLDNGTTYKVRCYKRPPKEGMFKSVLFWHWAIGDKIYDLVDVFFDPIQYRIEDLEKSGIVPEGYTQHLVNREYKVISNVFRTIFRNSSRLRLEFDLTPILGEVGYTAESIGN